MRACRHCSHQNADHLAYCSQCGRRMAIADGATAAGAKADPFRASTLTGAMSRTVLAPLPTGSTPASESRGDRAGGTGRLTATPDGRRAGAATSPLGWMAGSIGYIYVYLRGKLDAGERRRRLIAERDGAEMLLAGAVKELGLTILAQGIQHADLTGLLEAIGRAEARRETASSDISASEKLAAAEQGRLGAQELVLESEWIANDKASREADELIRGVSRENQEMATRLARAREARVRLERDAETAEAAPDGKQKAAHFRHEAAGMKSAEISLDAQVADLDQQLLEMRERSSSLRAAALASRASLDAAVTSRRGAGAAMKASIAGHTRERAEADREAGDLTAQLGRAAAQARPSAPNLNPQYSGVDRLEETIADRAQQIAALDRSLALYDHKKLLTGVGLLTSLFALMAAVIWVVLRR
jgi:hypothetical protein